MPLNNETLAAVPLDLDEAGQTRRFLLTLVEKLDIVLGYRGGPTYITAGSLASDLPQLNALELSILNIAQTATTAYVDPLIAGLKSSNAVADADNTVNTVSAPPTQAEVAALASQIGANADTFNLLLASLKQTEIIAS